MELLLIKDLSRFPIKISKLIEWCPFNLGKETDKYYLPLDAETDLINHNIEYFKTEIK